VDGIRLGALAAFASLVCVVLVVAEAAGAAAIDPTVATTASADIHLRNLIRPPSLDE
jgi:hypothetical protein